MTSDILYLDDDAECRELAKTFLEQEGYSVHTHADPEEGMGCYRGEPVVVTDYLFEGETTGMDVAQALDGDADVIVYTGYSQDFIETDSGEELPEDTGFLMKGGGFDELIGEVDRAFEEA